MNRDTRALILILTFVVTASAVVGLFLWFSSEVGRVTGSSYLPALVFGLLMAVWIMPKGKKS